MILFREKGGALFPPTVKTVGFHNANFMKKTVRKAILPKDFKDVRNGTKTFELSKDEDNIQAGDTLILSEYENGEYTGNSVMVKVSYVLRDVAEYGLVEGYVIIGFNEIFGCVKNGF